MARLVYMAGPLFSEAERTFLEKMASSLAESAGLDPYKDFFLPHRDGGELGKGPKRRDIFNLDLDKLNSADIIHKVSNRLFRGIGTTHANFNERGLMKL